MDDDEIDPAAYERVTNPERFEAVAVAARALIDRLVRDYDASAEPGSVDDFPERVPDGEVIRIVPRVGGDLAVLFSEFPGVFVRVGAGVVEPFPVCGCDACDEQPDGLIEELEELVAAFINGRLTETLGRSSHEFTLATPSQRESWSWLAPGDWKRYGELGTTTWPPWPRRAP